MYYPLGGAMRVNGTLYYVLKDHLGSASVVTDNSGNVVGDQRYYPFGETRLASGSMYTNKLFTGQRNIAGLGIYHYGARFYSPKLGRFLSADSIVPNPFNPQDYNRYSYVRNNPVKYTDPTGHRACITPEECADMGITPGGGSPSKPRPQPCTRNCGGGGGGGRGNDTPDPNPNGLPAPAPIPILGGDPNQPPTTANVGGGQPIPSLDPNFGGDVGPCDSDPDCVPYSSQVWSEAKLNSVISSLGQFEDYANGTGYLATTITVIAAFLGQPIVALAAGLVAVEAFWEANTANKLATYLTGASELAQEQGGIVVTLSNRDDVYAGIPVAVEYNGSDTIFAIFSPILRSAFDNNP